MSTFAVTNSNQVIDSVNYLLSNLDTSVTGNVTIPDGTLVANVTTGQITATGNVTSGANSYSYINQWINLRYANNASGSSGFSTVPTNSLYFGVYNSNISTASSNPAEYVWRQVAGGFGTTKTIYYSSIGGRQVQFAAANVAPSSNFVISVANVAIDLDVITTAAGLPGERGPIVMGYVITTADPASASSSTLTGWFSSARDALTPPIGTGLTPVTGDTAYFTYPTTGSSVTYEYNGSAWTSVIGQVVSGNVIVPNSMPGNTVIADTLNGNAIIGNTLLGNAIVVGTVTGNLIAASTIAGYNIIGNTITGNLIDANTITGDKITVGTLTGNLITVGTLTGNLIAANTITGTNITGNTITGNLLVANSFVANSINGDSITSASITTDKLAANVLTANTVVSTGATIGSFTSPGFWLQGTTGNARFGNTVSIGNNLSVGANATIGGNLTVTGLITAGSLIANTVQTAAINPGAVSSFNSAFNPAGTTFFGISSGGWTYWQVTSPSIQPGLFSIATTTTTADVYLNGSCFAEATINPSTSWSVTVDVGVFNRVNTSPYFATQIYNLRSQTFTGTTTGSQTLNLQADFAGYQDSLPVSTTRWYTYGIRVTVNSGTVSLSSVTFDNYNLLGQTLKR